MPDPVFTGVAAAVVTFFDEHGCVDAATTARHASHLADRGVNADRRRRHDRRSLAPVDEGAPVAARRRARRGAGARAR